MKNLKIFKSQLDLSSFALNASSVLVGRSSICDQVLIADGIKNIHFLIEWLGEGEFDPNSGDWVLYDVSNNTYPNQSTESASLDGIVLGNEPVSVGGVYFQIYQDRIQSTDISGLRFSQSVLQQVVDDLQTSNIHEAVNLNKSLSTKIIELVRIKSEDDSVINVTHIFKKSSLPQRNRFFPEFQIAWNLDQKLDLQFLNTPNEIINLKTKDIVPSSKITVSSSEIIKAVYEKSYVIIRFVKEQPFLKTNRLKSEDSFVLIFMGILFTSLAFFLLINPSQPPKISISDSSEMPRVVEIQEYAKSELTVSTTLPMVAPSAPSPEIQQAADQLSKKQPLINPEMPAPTTIPIIKKDKPESSAAVGVTHKTETPIPQKTSSGLNAPAAVSDVSQVGLLAKLKNSAATKNKISANDLNASFHQDVGPTQQSGIKIKSPTMGLLDPNLKKSDIKDSDLSQARTTLTGAENFQTDNVGPIAHADGLQGQLSLGTGQGRKKSLQAGGASNPGLNMSGTQGVSVQGGLTKSQVQEEIAKHRREIRTCFESALMIKDNLNGTVMYEWDIRADGVVDVITTKSSELKSSVVETCVSQIIKEIRFPKSKNGQPTKVFYPFLFQKK